MLKTCGKCGETKALDRFTKSTAVPSGYRSPCKDCNNAYYAKRRVEQYDKVREYEKKFHKERRLRYEYNMTEADLEALMEAQDNRCAICHNMSPLVVDHCHVKGKGTYRGLLCGMCNTGLGMFRDNKEALQEAINYLEKHGN